MITDHTPVHAAPDLAVVDLDGEAVVLSPQTGTYYGLNEVGARVLQLAQSPQTPSQLVTALLDEYEVPEATLRADVHQFLTEMAGAGLVLLADVPTHDLA